MPYIYPVILSGGVGSRLWPLSRSNLPKQLLPLASKHSLIQETALRATGPGFAKPSIICHAEHRFLVAEQLRIIGAEPENVFLEPVGRNTAPAAAIAALAIAQNDPDAVLLLMPADHVIRDRVAFLEAVAAAQTMAGHGYLVTFGIHPAGPETGYGYLQRGAALREGGKAFTVSRFVEKPDAETASRYVGAGDYYWNSGMFALQARTYLSELERLEPEIVTHCRQAICDGKQDADYFHLAAAPFSACKSISIDYAVMEHTDKAALVPVEMGWNDIGSWTALWDISSKDSDGNVVGGDVLHHNTRNSYLRSEGPMIAASGVKDLVVVASPDAILVSHKSAAQDIKKIVDQLAQQGRDLHVAHRKVHYPWGYSERIDGGDGFEVNHITVNPSATLSVRAEDPREGRWIVVSGPAKITRAGEALQLERTESCTLSNADYTLENPGSSSLEVIEVWFGSPAG